MKEYKCKHENEALILQCLSDHYGIEGSLSRLTGENINYLIMVDDKKRYVLKIVSADITPELMSMEDAAIKYAVSNGFRLELPRIVKNTRGKLYTGIKVRKNSTYKAIIYKFISGQILSSLSDISVELAENIGNVIALFDLSMENFDHLLAHQNHRWNLAEAGQHEEKIKLIDDSNRRELLTWAFATWFTEARPKLSALPHQFIHGDAHDENLLVKGGRITGLLDFGDSGFNPTICELATCLPYIMMGRSNPMEIAASVVAGYCSARPLSDAELSVIMPLVCGRLAMTVSIAAERRQIDPSHPVWFISEDRAWDLLAFLRALGSGVGIKQLVH
jgi:Ser/Thr protein kinase RdoA (MazF antagonist)